MDQWEKRAIQRFSNMSYQYCLLKKFISNYKYTILAQYLDSLGGTIWRKSKTNSVKAVGSPKVSEKWTLSVHILEENLFIVSKNTSYDEASGSALFLISS